MVVSYVTEEEEIIATEAVNYCMHCDEYFEYGTPMVEILVGAIGDNGFELAIAREELEYEPMYFHDECWIELLEEVTEKVDAPPSTCTFISCSLCMDNIDIGEPFGRVRPGTLVRSPFCPSGEQADEFVPHPNGMMTQVLCLACMNAIDLLLED